jgi:hypothetical protein
MKTKLEILNEIVNYYSEDTNRRAVEGESCVYITPDNRRCAVGMCLTDPTLMTGNKAINDDSFILEEDDNEFKPDILDLFKPEYQIDDVSFWAKLQTLHDTKMYWDDKGLTSEGQMLYNQLKEIYT